MKLFKSLLVLVMVAGLLAGCNGINVHPINHTEPMVNAVLIPDEEDPKIAKIREKVLFDFDSFMLDDDAAAVIDKVGDLMEEYPDTILALQGHTDKYGSDEYNQKLSMQRAIEVENALVELGVDRERIVKVEGFGKSQLLKSVTNHENRRVLILSVGE